jgi:hypothetical protein
MYKIVDIIRYRALQHRSVIATGVITNAAVIISVLSAFPWIRKSVSHLICLDEKKNVSSLTVRSNYHNTFERHHRFIGWLGIAVREPSRLFIFWLDADRPAPQATWVFVILGNTYDIKCGEWRSDANSLLSVQELWFAGFMTILYVTESRWPNASANSEY